ncbi:hypothetical protein GGR52DRAFT_585221 [Hypoxylon sp. FL1284]|nr:hypothetical protein GGR52DRAFT_585221 [Hypoxylon sp. FL1284]
MNNLNSMTHQGRGRVPPDDSRTLHKRASSDETSGVDSDRSVRGEHYPDTPPTPVTLLSGPGTSFPVGDITSRPTSNDYTDTLTFHERLTFALENARLTQSPAFLGNSLVRPVTPVGSSRHPPHQHPEVSQDNSTTPRASSRPQLPSRAPPPTTIRQDPPFGSQLQPHHQLQPQPHPTGRPAAVGAAAAGHHSGFVPMNAWPAAARWGGGAAGFLAAGLGGRAWAAQLAATGASPFYRGNPFLEANQSADVAEAFNTSLWLTNLPPTCTHRELLGAIRRCGKVFATVINPPEEDASLLPPPPGVQQGNVSPSISSSSSSTGPFGPAGAAPPRRLAHTTSASKLVFFDRRGVDRLLAQARAGLFVVGGYVPRVRPNRIRSAPRDPGPQCRVLHIEGPAAVVNEAFLHAFFRAKFNYELESVVTLGTFGGSSNGVDVDGEGRDPDDGVVVRQEWRFGSFRCQAESARQSIAREKDRRDVEDLDAHRRLWGQVMVHYGVDPCAY